jgi:hypothetical protein
MKVDFERVCSSCSFDFNERSQERMDFGFVRESNSVCSSLSPQKQLKGLEISKDLLKTASFNVSFQFQNTTISFNSGCLILFFLFFDLKILKEDWFHLFLFLSLQTLQKVFFVLISLFSFNQFEMKIGSRTQSFFLKRAFEFALRNEKQ